MTIKAYEIANILDTKISGSEKVSMTDLKRFSRNVWRNLGLPEDKFPHIYTSQSLNWMRRNEGLVLSRMKRNTVGSTHYFKMSSGRFRTGDIVIEMKDRSLVTMLHELAHAALYARDMMHDHGQDFLDMEENIYGACGNTFHSLYQSVRRAVDQGKGFEYLSR